MYKLNTNPTKLLNDFVSYFNRGDYQLIIENSKHLENIYSNSEIFLNLLGASYAQTGDVDAALIRFTKSNKISPNNLGTLNNIGNCLKILDRYDEAISIYRKCISKNQKNHIIWSNLGACYRSTGKIDQAIDAYQTSISIKNDYAPSWKNLGNALSEKGKLDEAVAAYKRALEIEPDDADAYCNMGSVLQKEWRHDEALAAYGRAISLKPDSLSAFCGRGWIFAEREDWEGAKSEYEIALNHDPSYLAAISELSRVPDELLSRGRVVELLAALESVEEKNEKPYSPSLFFTKARLFAHLKKYDESFSYIKQANSQKLIDNDGVSESWKNLFDKTESELNIWVPSSVDQNSSNGCRLVFILGASRSGKTLTEKALSVDNAVFPGYEAGRADVAINSLRQMIHQSRQERRGNKADLRLQVLKALLPHLAETITKEDYKIVTITNPFFLHASHYVYDIYDQSYFVFLHRDPLDNAADVFAKDYEIENSFAFQPRTALEYVKRYRDVSHVMCKKMGKRAKEVNFGAALNSPRTTASELYGFLGIEPPDVCLNITDDQRDHEVQSPYRKHFEELLSNCGNVKG